MYDVEQDVEVTRLLQITLNIAEEDRPYSPVDPLMVELRRRAREFVRNTNLDPRSTAAWFDNEPTEAPSQEVQDLLEERYHSRIRPRLVG